jgi:hypothetical protein
VARFHRCRNVRRTARVAVPALLLMAGTAQAAPPIPFLPEATGPTVTPGQTDVQFHGFIQAEGEAWDQSSENQLTPVTSQPLNQERLLIRRARVEVDVRRGPLLGVIELDGNTVHGPAFGLASAEISYLAARKPPARPDLVMLSIGLLRIPFGAEVQERDRDRLFLERSNVSRALFPGTFDLALRMQARWRALVLQLALTNGEPLGSGTFAGQDPTAAKDLVGRVGVTLARGSRIHVDGGLSILEGTGFQPGTPATKDVLVWKDENEDGIVQTTEIQIIPGSPATPSSTFHRFAAGCDLRITAALPRVGELMAFGEIVWAGNLDRALIPADPVASGRDIRELGMVAGLVQNLGAHLALGARFDWYNADLDASAALPVGVVPASATFSTTALLAAWRFSELDRVAVELDINRNPYGRSASGLPTNLPSNTLIVRAQLGF